VRDSHDVLLGQYRKRLAFYEQCGYQLTMKGPGDTDYKPIRVRRTRAAPVNPVGGAGTAVGDDEEKGVDYGDVAEEGVASYKKEEPIPSAPMFRMAPPVSVKKV
jgi:hypothetical protein